MKKAVEEWQTHTGRYIDRNGEARSLHVFCNIVGIPYDTFKKYVTSSNNQTKRQLEGTMGRPSVVDPKVCSKLLVSELCALLNIT
eukprot:scaffold45987_cov32-Attheya_sp.AAC.6